MEMLWDRLNTQHLEFANDEEYDKGERSQMIDKCYKLFGVTSFLGPKDIKTWTGDNHFYESNIAAINHMKNLLFQNHLLKVDSCAPIILQNDQTSHRYAEVTEFPDSLSPVIVRSIESQKLDELASFIFTELEPPDTILRTLDLDKPLTQKLTESERLKAVDEWIRSSLERNSVAVTEMISLGSDVDYIEIDNLEHELYIESRWLKELDIQMKECVK
jgi:hypothetical protein